MYVLALRTVHIHPHVHNVVPFTLHSDLPHARMYKCHSFHFGQVLKCLSSFSLQNLANASAGVLIKFCIAEYPQNFCRKLNVMQNCRRFGSFLLQNSAQNV